MNENLRQPLKIGEIVTWIEAHIDPYTGTDRLLECNGRVISFDEEAVVVLDQTYSVPEEKIAWVKRQCMLTEDEVESFANDVFPNYEQIPPERWHRRVD